MIVTRDVPAGSRWFQDVLGDGSNRSRANGVLLWFATDDFEGLVDRVERSGATVLDGPLYNPNGRQQEIWLEGPEGYRVVVVGPRNSRSGS